MVATVKEVKIPKKPIPVIGSLQTMYNIGRFMFKKPVTVQYPEDKGEIPERFRFRIFLSPEACIGCTYASRFVQTTALRWRSGK